MKVKIWGLILLSLNTVSLADTRPYLPGNGINLAHAVENLRHKNSNDNQIWWVKPGSEYYSKFKLAVTNNQAAQTQHLLSQLVAPFLTLGQIDNRENQAKRLLRQMPFFNNTAVTSAYSSQLPNFSGLNVMPNMLTMPGSTPKVNPWGDMDDEDNITDLVSD